MNFVDRFEALCLEKHKAPSAVGQELGFTKSAISRWRNGSAKPSFDSLSVIANYFGVSTDYLLGNTDIKNPPEQSAPEDIAKVALFGGDGEVTDEMWEEVKDYVEYIKQKHLKD